MLAALTVVAITGLGVAAPAHANGPPAIRLSAANRVPACVTPDALMAFTRTRNSALTPKFQTIARHYRDIGEALGVRWDYAYYQMLIETNYLQFRRGDGSPGDVSASQNNFAGIGATGGGVPGDRFPDVRTGVLAQVQHLVAYSGERVADPVANRTREKQGDIIFLSLKLNRPVTFGDLARRWAVDPAYSRSIETIANLFRQSHCENPRVEAQAAARSPASVQASQTSRAAMASVRTAVQVADAAPSRPLPSVTTRTGAALAVKPASGANRLGAPPSTDASARDAASAIPGLVNAPLPVPPCALFTASFGGDVTRLISSRQGSQRRVTALTVSRANADAETQAFMKAHAPGGQVIGSYDTIEAALVAGERACPAR